MTGRTLLILFGYILVSVSLGLWALKVMDFETTVILFLYMLVVQSIGRD